MVIIAYTVVDEFLARSVDLNKAGIYCELRHWLYVKAAIAYIAIIRNPRNLQAELPSPVGRPLMDTLTISAVSYEARASAAFHIDKVNGAKSCRLVAASATHAPSGCVPLDLLEPAEEQPTAEPVEPPTAAEAFLAF